MSHGAQVSPSKLVPTERVAKCVRLTREFMAYVARKQCLRKTFISIKGYYYQVSDLLAK